MKNILKLFVLVGTLAFASCEDKSGLNNVFDKPAVSDKAIEITIDNEEGFELNETTQWETFSFSWTEAVPPTSDYTIAGYKALIVPAEQPKAEPMVIEFDAETTSHEFTLRDLYLHMYNNWVFTPGLPMDLRFEILAEITGGQFYYKPMISEKIFSFTPVEIPVRKFYVTGDAAPGGSPIAVECTQQGYSDQVNQKLEMKLNPNSTFVLSLSPTEKFPAFMRGAKLEGDFVDGYEAVLVQTEAEAANYEPFETRDPYQEESLGIKENYAITIEFDSKAMSANVYCGRKCTMEVWGVGDGLAKAWGNHIQFTWNYKYPDAHYLVHEFYDKPTTGSEGNFKLNITNGYKNQGESWRPAKANASPFSDNRVVTKTFDGGDPKWHIPDGMGGTYICVLNNADLTIQMIPVQ